MNLQTLLGRTESLFHEDIGEQEQNLSETIRNSKFLVIGGAGSIGQAVTLEIFKRDPKKLDVVDISENNLVELVRRIRSEIGYSSGEFNTYAIDVGGIEFRSLLYAKGRYDYVINLSALKHVRSEKDQFTLMRLLDTNILQSLMVMEQACCNQNNKYFAVSTDKAANPANIMGASKRIMEMALISRTSGNSISMARFANVAFSDGSLLHGFNQRFLHEQPLTAPMNICRYFLSPQEAGELCLVSALLGRNFSLLFPKLNQDIDLMKFTDIAIEFIEQKGFKPYLCESEKEARMLASVLIKEKKWPCYFFQSDTTGEKDFEEFYTEDENPDLSTFKNIGSLGFEQNNYAELVDNFINDIKLIRDQKSWEREDLVRLVKNTVPELDHKETGKFLNERM